MRKSFEGHQRLSSTHTHTHMQQSGALITPRCSAAYPLTSSRTCTYCSRRTADRYHARGAAHALARGEPRLDGRTTTTWVAIDRSFVARNATRARSRRRSRRVESRDQPVRRSRTSYLPHYDTWIGLRRPPAARCLYARPRPSTASVSECVRARALGFRS